MAVVLGGILLLRLHAFLALLFGALVVALLTSPQALEQYGLERGRSPAQARGLAEQAIGERVAGHFGRTCGQVGIIIAMASIIGVCLLSGAADRLVRSALRWFGEKRAPLAFLGSGFLLAIPVFFDTVFYLMIPLAKATRWRTGRNYLWFVLAVVAGGTMAHSLVPPTPGPLFVAAELRVDLGVMIIGGCMVGLLAAVSGYWFAGWANRRWEIPLRESEEALQQLRELSGREERELPSVWVSVLPILLPVLLIAVATVLTSVPNSESQSGAGDLMVSVVRGLGNKNIALLLAAVIALLTLLAMTSGRQTLSAVRTGLPTAGVIILIIGAGGAFGGLLQETGIASSIERLTTTYQMAVLPLAFLLTAAVRTAQGSATVAMITAAGAFSGLADPSALGFHPLYLALAIGCGSKPIWWMNDSGFWVVSQMSGLSEEEALKTLTPMTLLMGVVGLIFTLLGAWLLPLV